MIGFQFDSSLFDQEAKEKTPDRVSRMMKEFQEWRDWSDLETGKGVFEGEYNDLVLVKDIEFTSFCEHHVLPFYGKASIAYLPHGHIVGLSKIPRTVRKFASGPQLQERLTHQIADYLTRWIPENEGVMVMIEAEHLCMEIRGARMHGTTVTSAVRGKFSTQANLKSETLELMRR